MYESYSSFSSLELLKYLLAKLGKFKLFFIANSVNSSIPFEYLAQEKAVDKTSFLRKGNHSLSFFSQLSS